MKPALKCQDLCKSFGSTVALRGLNITIDPGECVAILGPNGSGKTTLIRLILGLLKPTSGNISVLDGTPGSVAVKQSIGAMLQDAALPDQLTVAELIMLFRSYYAAPRSIESVLSATGLSQLQSVWYGRLSGGQKQRVQCAVALCGGPKLLILDEPTASLDVAARQDFHKMITAERRKGTTILITSHDIAEVGQMASRIIVFANGRILADGTQDQLVQRIQTRDLLINTVLSSEYIMTLPSVVSVKRQGAQMIVRSRNLEGTIAALRAHDSNLSGPIVQPTDLQTAYLELVEGLDS